MITLQSFQPSVKTVTASHSCGNESSISYSLWKTDSVKEPFRINTQSGRICLDSILDYEQCTIYQLHVYAHHINGRSSRTLLNVHVEDVNDNAPIFYPEQYNVSVRENVEIGSSLTLLLATDADSGIYGQILSFEVRYRFVAEESGAFRLDEKSGRLYVKKKLSKGDYHLRVEAVDGSGLVSEKQAVVHVTVVSSSTLTPQFTHTLYEVSVLEETLPGIAIGEVKAEGSFPINYNVYSGDSDHFFVIDAKNGQISVAQYLDADKWEQLLLNVQARMDGYGANYTQVLIKLTDTNDNAPTFEMGKVESYIYEDHPTHQPFFAVQAYDKDRGKNGEVIYALLKSEPPCPVSIRPLSGELTLVASLDFEATNKYHLVVQARDQGIPPRSSNISVVLNVLDVNDNRPEFKQQMYAVGVPEDVQLMTDILTVQAKDLDSEQNARIAYRLSEENRDFGIHPVIGNIFVKAPLDREMVAEYRLFVVASDLGKPEFLSQATIHIKVLDINDNSPSCPTANSFTLTSEIDAGEIFEKVIATDPDEGLNGSLLYRLHVEDVNFAIHDNGELFVKKKLSEKDYRKESRLSIIVLDRNGDMQARSTICPIRIIAGKMHSKVKFLEPMDRIIKISKKCTSGCLLKVLNATNVVRWEIEMSDISSNFEILNNTLRTSTYFNAATVKDNRTLSLMAFDSNGRRKQITFTIHSSVSELSHLTDKTTVIKISKTTRVGSKLMTLSSERNSETFWHLQNETDAFYLDSITSDLYLTTSIRWAHDKSYLLKVQKWNPPHYHQIEQQNVYIEIESANIHWPQFSDCPRFLTVKENEPTGSVVGRVPAEDAEEGTDGQLSYSIVEGSAGLFSIDPDTAEILLIRSLHWEQASDLSLFLVVEVEDNYREMTKRSHCTVFIDVEDTNDHQPQFLSSLKITINSDFVEGDIIHHIVAVDDDAGDNAKITYALVEGNLDDAFIIDPNIGALALKHRFSGERSIRVRASDNGVPPKYTEENITVRFDSGHRQWRFFPQRKYLISVNSSTTPGTVLFDFFAKRTEWPHMKLFSYFVSENDFLQLSDDGKLILLRAITPGKYDWLVTASGEEGLIDWTFFHLNVIGTNQYPPRISSSSCGNLTIRENIAAKHLTRIYAWDEDGGSDGEIQYKIVGKRLIHYRLIIVTLQMCQNEKDKNFSRLNNTFLLLRLFFELLAGNENSAFFLNSSTGMLSCRELDRERQSLYFLVITAEDQGVPKRADTCTLWITVIDENDNVPVFDDTIPTLIEIDDSRQVGDILGRLSATDQDEGPGGKVIYNLVEDTSGLLDIRADTGEIIFARDYPTSQSEYTIKLRAEDQGVSRVLSSEVDIQLHLIRPKSKLTLKEPQFLSKNYIGFINEGEQRGQFVLQVRSLDRLTEDAPLAYSIVSGNMDAAFDIDDDGRITTAQELDFEIENVYTLKVIGTGSMTNTSETDVHIRVINTNDNVPSFPMLKTRKVSESATYGTLVETVVATDVDADTQLEYSLLSSDDLFEIDPFTGKIFLIQNLDYESKKEHTIHIQVTDGENTSRATMRIIVEDVNDNVPQFEEQFYLINIEKDVEFGSTIAKIRASDPDTGPAGAVRYELIMNNTRDFRIDPESGDLLAVGKLENQSTHYLKVRAFDRGRPIQSSTVVVQINVGIEDHNRKLIKFTETTFNFTIPENTRPYTEFGKVTLMDDFPTNTVLRIQNAEHANVFHISRDGSIFLKYPVDAEFKSEYEFLVEASSPHATHNSSTKVYVKVMDLNDNVPYFTEKINEITISEGMIANEALARYVEGCLTSAYNDYLTNRKIKTDAKLKNVARFAATDTDSGDNGRVSYLILSGNDYGMFNLNSSSGVLYFEKNVDVEEIHLNESLNNLLIAAIDNGTPTRLNWTSVRVRFNSEFLSANAPFFIVSQYETSVFEDLPRGSVVLRSKAVNKLGLSDGDWIYTVTDTNESFTCNKSSGHIILVKDLDFERQTKYEFILKVQDNRNRSATVAVRIRVLGIDEYPPIFTETNYVFQVRIIALTYLMVSATDDDSGIDGVIRYEIQGSAARYLSIDSSTGEIVLSDKLHYRTAINFTSDEFIVIASSSAKQSSHMKVIIQIGDFSPDVFSTTKIMTVTQILIIGSLLLFFVLLLTLIVLVINMRTRSRTKPKKEVYSVKKSNFAMVRDLNLPSPNLEREIQLAPLPSSPCAKFKVLPMGTQMGSHSATYSMPDSGIDPDDMSVTSSVTDYLNQVGVTPNKYFESNQGSSREPLPGYKDDVHSDPEISDLIYAKVDEILSPTSRLNTNADNFDPAPAFRPLNELLLEMKKEQSS
uniref:CA domain-containing protein n=1 Tax=Elaeophora elaphi TaxID=1147741 RepID=A0A0R3RP85_9BILA